MVSECIEIATRQHLKKHTRNTSVSTVQGKEKVQRQKCMTSTLTGQKFRSAPRTAKDKLELDSKEIWVKPRAWIYKERLQICVGLKFRFGLFLKPLQLQSTLPHRMRWRLSPVSSPDQHFVTGRDLCLSVLADLFLCYLRPQKTDFHVFHNNREKRSLHHTYTSVLWAGRIVKTLILSRHPCHRAVTVSSSFKSASSWEKGTQHHFW